MDVRPYTDVFAGSVYFRDDVTGCSGIDREDSKSDVWGLPGFVMGIASD